MKKKTAVHAEGDELVVFLGKERRVVVLSSGPTMQVQELRKSEDPDKFTPRREMQFTVMHNEVVRVVSVAANRRILKGKPEQKIASSLPKGIFHRGGVWKCPHCDWQDAEFKTEKWNENGVLLVTDIVHGKHGSVAFVSECPSCFKKSWVHMDLGIAEDCDEFPLTWRKKATEIRETRHLLAMRKFMGSRCARCALLRSFECDTLPVVKCTYGWPEDEVDEITGGRMIHTSFSSDDCSKFKPIDGDTKEVRDRIVHFFGQTDGTFKFPNSCEGDVLKLAARALRLIP